MQEVFFPPTVVCVGGRNRQPSVDSDKSAAAAIDMVSPTPTFVSRFQAGSPASGFGIFNKDGPGSAAMERRISTGSTSSSSTTLQEAPISLSPTKHFKQLLSKQRFIHLKAYTLSTTKAKHEAYSDDDLDFTAFLKSPPASVPRDMPSLSAAQAEADRESRKQAKEQAKLEKMREIVRIRNEKIDRQDAKKRIAKMQVQAQQPTVPSLRA